MSTYIQRCLTILNDFRKGMEDDRPYLELLRGERDLRAKIASILRRRTVTKSAPEAGYRVLRDELLKLAAAEGKNTKQQDAHFEEIATRLMGPPATVEAPKKEGKQSSKKSPSKVVPPKGKESSTSVAAPSAERISTVHTNDAHLLKHLTKTKIVKEEDHIEREAIEHVSKIEKENLAKNPNHYGKPGELMIVDETKDISPELFENLPDNIAKKITHFGSKTSFIPSQDEELTEVQKAYAEYQRLTVLNETGEATDDEVARAAIAYSDAKNKKSGTILDGNIPRIKELDKRAQQELDFDTTKEGRTTRKVQFKQPAPTPMGRLFSEATKEDNAPHLIIVARAGTGKTTTLVEGLKGVVGNEPSKMTPSPQQKVIWESMALSRGKASSIAMVAFNKSIASELQLRVPRGVDAMTMHSMGFKAVNKHLGRLRVEAWRVDNLISQHFGVDTRELRKTKLELITATKQLVELCKMNLTDYNNREELENLIGHYDIEMPGASSEVFELLAKLMEWCKDPQRDGCIDYADMIWLPIALNLPLFRYDLLLVDEAQDLNRCQQALAKRAGKRLILCGDPKQAIYGFAGADSQSMDRMIEELSGKQALINLTKNMPEELHPSMLKGACIPPRCIVLPLTVTRRCGKAIVKEANNYVQDFEAFEHNCEGTISHARYDDKLGGSIDPVNDLVSTSEKANKAKTTYHSMVEYGDMVLCRVNAPLVSQCFRFIRQGRKANIQGRDVGQGLISLIKRLSKDSQDVVDLVSRLSDWRHSELQKENAKRNPNEGRLIAIEDRADCILCFTEGASMVEEVIKKVEMIFTDDRKSPGIRLSSVHKAKGLEAKRVFILQPKGATIPHPMARTKWQREQEFNLLYVAITRAIEELVYVS